MSVIFPHQVYETLNSFQFTIRVRITASLRPVEGAACLPVDCTRPGCACGILAVSSLFLMKRRANWIPLPLSGTYYFYSRPVPLGPRPQGLCGPLVPESLHGWGGRLCPNYCTCFSGQ